MNTPWGLTNDVAVLEHGILRVDTPSHGGYYVPDEVLERIPEAHRAYAARWSGSEHWYEEDCAWAAVALAFPEIFTREDGSPDTDALEVAHQIVADYFQQDGLR